MSTKMDEAERPIIPHRDLPRRMLAAVAVRVAQNNANQGVASNARRRARLQESNEILGILRNVVRAYESTETPV